MEKKVAFIVITAFAPPMLTQDQLVQDLTDRRVFTKFEKAVGSDYWIEKVQARFDLGAFAAEVLAAGAPALKDLSAEQLRALSDAVSAEGRRRIEADYAARGVEIEY